MDGAGDAAFRTTVFPQRRAGAIFQAGMAMGKSRRDQCHDSQRFAPGHEEILRQVVRKVCPPRV